MQSVELSTIYSVPFLNLDIKEVCNCFENKPDSTTKGIEERERWLLSQTVSTIPFLDKGQVVSSKPYPSAIRIYIEKTFGYISQTRVGCVS